MEAYLGVDDPASHARSGPRGRASTMFGEPGRLYVYLSYGVHRAANVVCSPSGSASAVLLRAGRVLSGEQTVRARRQADRSAGSRRPMPAHRLASGPGNLGRALGLSLADDGAVLGEDVTLEPAQQEFVTSTGPRVGVSVAADWPLRFWITGDPTVSQYRRSPRAAPPPAPITQFTPERPAAALL